MRQMTVASLSSNSSLQTDPSFPSTVTIILPSKLVFPDNVTDSCRTVRRAQYVHITALGEVCTT